MPQSDGGGAEPTAPYPLVDVESYTYASCQQCPWKLSRYGDQGNGAEAAEFVKRGAEQHAYNAAHVIAVFETRVTEFDGRHLPSHSSAFTIIEAKP